MTPRSLAAPRILVADDEPDLLTIMRETLESEGFVVECAHDGNEALKMIQNNPPDIAVLDLRMPRMDGFEVCRRLREDPLYEHLPCIILSASGTRDSKVEGLTLGADDFITKPVDIVELLARVRMILKRTRQGLDANPLTRLPGNVSIETHVEDALAEGRPLAVLYIDLNQFKAFNDAYGYDAGDRVIKGTGLMLLRIARERHGRFLGHIGGDDFIVMTAPDDMEPVARKICEEFDKMAPSFYNEADRARKRIVSTDRQGRMIEFPLLSVSIGICHNTHRRLTSYAQVSQYGAELKKAAKQISGSAFVVDRRRD